MRARQGVRPRVFARAVLARVRHDPVLRHPPVHRAPGLRGARVRGRRRTPRHAGAPRTLYRTVHQRRRLPARLRVPDAARERHDSVVGLGARVSADRRAARPGSALSQRKRSAESGQLRNRGVRGRRGAGSVQRQLRRQPPMSERLSLRSPGRRTRPLPRAVRLRIRLRARSVVHVRRRADRRRGRRHQRLRPQVVRDRRRMRPIRALRPQRRLRQTLALSVRS